MDDRLFDAQMEFVDNALEILGICAKRDKERSASTLTVTVFYSKEMPWPFTPVYPELTLENLEETHVELMDLVIPNSTAPEVSLEEVFVRMQSDVWSLNGEAKELIRSKGLAHTSMSVGDVVKTKSNILYVCEAHSWRKIKKENHSDDQKTCGVVEGP
jgi:hypothetical protein